MIGEAYNVVNMERQVGNSCKQWKVQRKFAVAQYKMTQGLGNEPGDSLKENHKGWFFYGSFPHSLLFPAIPCYSLLRTSKKLEKRPRDRTSFEQSHSAALIGRARHRHGAPGRGPDRRLLVHERPGDLRVNAAVPRMPSGCLGCPKWRLGQSDFPSSREDATTGTTSLRNRRQKNKDYLWKSPGCLCCFCLCLFVACFLACLKRQGWYPGFCCRSWLDINIHSPWLSCETTPQPPPSPP